MTLLIGTVETTGEPSLANGNSGTRLICRDYVAAVSGSLETISYLDNGSDSNLIFLVYSGAGALLGITGEVAPAEGAITGTLETPVAIEAGLTYKLCAYCKEFYFRYLSNGDIPVDRYDGGTYLAPSANITTEEDFGIDQMQLWGNGTEGESYTIDSLTSPLRVGGIANIQTSGLGDLTIATTVGGKPVAAANAPDGDGTITVAGFVNGESYPLMGTVYAIARDGVNESEPYESVLDTLAGWQYVNVLDMNTGPWSIGKAVSGDTVITQAHVINDGTGILNRDLTLTDWALGDYVAWLRDDEGIMHKVNFTAGEGGPTMGGFDFVQEVQFVGFIQ